jgi:hypothetical protein
MHRSPWAIPCGAPERIPALQRLTGSAPLSAFRECSRRARYDLLAQSTIHWTPYWSTREPK